MMLRLCVAAALLISVSSAPAQQGATGAMPGMQMPPQASSSSSIPQTSPATAPPDLLAEAKGREPLTLDRLLALARRQNPTLRAARAAIAESAGNAKQAGLLPNPVVGYEGDQIRGGSYGGGEQGGFVQQTIPLGGKLGLRRDIYRQQQHASELTLIERQSRVEADVESSFYAALTLAQEIETRRRLYAIAADASATAHQLANVGQADAPDVLQAEVEEEQASLDVMAAERRYLAAFRQVTALAGSPEMPLAPLAGDLASPPATPDSLDRLLQQSPAVARADQDVGTAEAALRSARREVVPDLTLRAGEQWNGELLREHPNLPAGAQSFASASIDLPLWNRNQGGIATAEAAAEAARAEAERVRLELRHAAAPLAEQYQIAATQAQQYRSELLPRAERAYQMYRDRYQQMAAAYPQVLVAQRTLFQLRLAYVQALGEEQQAAAQLRHFTLSNGLSANQP